MVLFAKFMRDLRRKKGWSLATAAEEIGISEFHLAQVEKRYKLLEPYYLLKVADIFDYPFAELSKLNFIIDEYEDAVHVRWVFEELDMEPCMWMHIKSVDKTTKEDIEKMKKHWEDLRVRASMKRA